MMLGLEMNPTEHTGTSITGNTTFQFHFTVNQKHMHVIFLKKIAIKLHV